MRPKFGGVIVDKYPTPPGGSVEPIVREIKSLRTRARAVERPTGTSIASLVAQVQAALVNITETVVSATTTFLASGFTTGSMTATGSITAGGSVTATGNVSGADSHLTGDLYSPHGRATPVTTGYVSAWLNGDGRLGASASSLRFKQDIEPADTTEEVDALLRLALIRYRYIADVEENGDAAPWHLGSIAEYMQQTALAEWVPLDQNGDAFAINWEQIAIPAVAALQRLYAGQKDLIARVTALEAGA